MQQKELNNSILIYACIIAILLLLAPYFGLTPSRFAGSTPPTTQPAGKVHHPKPIEREPVVATPEESSLDDIESLLKE